jgi:hypothetical protein
MIKSVQAELEELIFEVNAAAPGNSWDLRSLRKKLLEFAIDIRADAERFPGEALRPDWNLVARDGDLNESAAFIVFVFAADHATIAAGRGEMLSIREYAENDSPVDPLLVIPEAAMRFQMAGRPRTFDRGSFDEWLEGSTT